MTELSLAEQFERLKTARVLMVFDHARAGNAFFKRIFDRHPEVLCIPVVSYLYNRTVSQYLEGAETAEGSVILRRILGDGEIHRIVSELTPEAEQDIIRYGDDPNARVDRAKVGRILAELLQDRREVTRHDILTAIFLAHAIGVGEDTSRVKYLLTDASPHNDVGDGERLNRRLFDAIKKDPVRIVHLVRDPRASFASIRHQYVNQFGVMYPIRSRKIWQTAKCNCVWMWTLKYTAGGARAMAEFRGEFAPLDWFLVRNEDLNLDFQNTMRKLTAWLDVDWHEPWSAPDYVPTSYGIPHKGVSGYTRMYNRNEDGPIENEPDEKARFPGPNVEVTRRWRRMLRAREVKILEAVYYEEMKEHGYVFDHVRDDASRKRALFSALLPFGGEFPTRMRWWTSRKRLDKKLVFLLFFPFSYALARLSFYRMYFAGGLSTR